MKNDKSAAAPPRVVRTEAEWRARLTPEQFAVTRQHGTERACSSPLNQEKRPGTFACVCCDAPLFRAGTKFESGTGWPSFFEPVAGAVTEHEDNSFLMRRTEVRCAACDAHLGHVFPDGPPPTGQRYCMNGIALRFQPDGEPDAG
jgi:peptide-methionine (R)-S-oxide reductase